jgi:hypothetical protein
MLMAAVGGGALHAQNFSGLQGKALTPAGDLGSGVQSVLGGLLGTAGTLDAVVVTDDREQRLVVSVDYKDWPGRQIQGELRDRDRKSQPWFGLPTAALAAGAGQVELVFAMGPDAPKGTALESAHLRLRVLRPGLPLPEIERSFVLRKKWQMAVDPASVVVRVVPRPEGAAAELREQEKTKIPLPPARQPGPRAAAASVATKPRTRPPTATPRPRPILGTRSVVAVNALPKSSRLQLLNKFTFGIPPAVKDRAGKGPGSAVFDLLEGLRADVSLTRDAVVGISTSVFQDQNPESGLFYFLPQAYALEWTPAGGYGMRMLYSAAREGEAGEVMMAARLDAGVDSREVEVASKLLRAYQARHPQVKFSELRALPIDAPPNVSLAGDLQHQYEIPPEKITIHALSDALGEIDVSWVTDTVTKENVQLALVEEVGINGSLTLQASGEVLAAQSIPVRLRLADAATLGRIFWRRGEAWRNETPYPVRLTYLHALLIEKNAPIVYSWSLDGVTVPPRARAEFDAATVPTWLDSRAVRLWIEYAPVESCEACDQELIAAITGGVTSLGASQITFHTITPLADLGAYEITATVRSRYFDPRTRQSQTKPAIPLKADNQDFTVGPIYLVNRQAGESVPGDPLFEYSLDVSMPDGTIRRGTRWIAADGLRVLVGRVQVEQSVGPLPSGGGAQP